MATLQALSPAASSRLLESSTAVRSGSLRRRVSILIGLLLGAAGLVSSWLAYREVQHVLRANGHERMVSAAQQIADLLAQTSVARTGETRRIAADLGVQQPTLTGDLAALPPPPPALKAVFARSGQVVVSLYDGTGRAVAQLLPRADLWSVPAAAPPPLSTDAISPLVIREGYIAFRTTAPIPAQAEGAAPIGFISIDRALAASPARALIERLIGTDAAIKLGNAKGDVWTDLSTTVAPPPAAAPGTPARYRSADGKSHLGTSVAVNGTPWLVWVDFPEATLLKPASALLGRLMPVMGFVIVLGAVAVYAVAARITTPLEQLAGAADGIASGDLSRRVDGKRGDEIGRVGRAFNAMAERVSESHQALEARVQARTAELERALDTLRETQEELVRRERLATLGQLASSVGHELRNPLGVMTNAVYFLKVIQPNAPEQVSEYLGILRHQIGLAEKIVGDLLDFARLKAPQRQEVAVRALLDEQVARLGAFANVAIEIECPASTPAISVDPVQVGQIMLNLLTNAQQAMEAGGGTLTVRARPAGRAVTIQVVDTGPGVPLELHDKIFEPLFTTKARGIGLGLAVSRSLAESNGGTLTVSSAPGQGATFSLTLPTSAASHS
jgi:signal transduction histidine kinase